MSYFEQSPEDKKWTLPYTWRQHQRIPSQPNHSQGFWFHPKSRRDCAEAPALLKAGMALWDLFSTTSFSPIEQQVVYLAANYENEPLLHGSTLWFSQDDWDVT